MLEWLETFLRGWNGACLIVSHDRYFLDRVTTRTMDVAFGTLEDYPAPYSRFLALREERYERRVKEYEEQQEFINRTEEFIRKYKAGQRSREAKGRQTRLDRLERIARPQQNQELNIRLTTATRSGRIVLSTTPGLKAGYPPETPGGEPHVLVEAPALQIERGERVGLIGPNGAGKSTLLKTLVGELKPIKGRVDFGTNVKVGYYAQAHEQLPRHGTPLSVLMSTAPMGEEFARTYLGRFLFSEDDVFKQVESLSGGERSRLALAMLLMQQSNFLILDEPTNHLDISSRETLEELLATFDGTILFVSHDRYFMDRIATRIWSVEDGGITQNLGNYTDYQRVIGRREEAAKPEPEPEKAVVVEPVREQRSRPVSDSKLQKTLAQSEREIAKLEGRLNELSDAMTVAGIDGDAEAVGRLGQEYEKVHADLDLVYARWEETSAQLDALLAESAP
jgi:ATP-binding cassette subfamily F protein 3